MHVALAGLVRQLLAGIRNITRRHAGVISHPPQLMRINDWGGEEVILFKPRCTPVL